MTERHLRAGSAALRSTGLRRLAGALLVASVALGGSAAAESRAPDSPFIRDEQGRALILHGLNVAGTAKHHPERVPWVTREDVLRISEEWGFNFVRYLIFWDAVEPAPGVYDAAYIERTRERLDWFAEAGVYVVLDMHQDIYAQEFCCDGAPPWATITDGLPHYSFDMWELHHLSPAVARAYRNFFDYSGAHPELQEHYAAMWAHVASELGSHPAVIGYDLMNEPFSIHSLVDTQRFDREWLQPFYERVIAAIRAVDPDHWIFYSPQAFLVSDGRPSYLMPIADPRPGEPRLAYFPHAYAIALELSPDPESPAGQRQHQRFLERYERERRADVELLGTPLFIGEFGASDLNAGNTLRDQLALWDRLHAGWTYWDHDDPPGLTLTADNEESEIMKQLVRVYPQRVAGQPLEYGFDPAGRIFQLSYRDRPGTTGPSVIYVPESRFYPQGFSITVSDAPGTWGWRRGAGTDLIEVELPRTGGEHTIRIEPASD